MSNKLINRDLTIKALSVMLALLLWFYVITEQNPEITKDITIPVRLLNTVFLEKSNMVLVEDSNNYKLTMRIKGKKNVLDKLNDNTVDAYADLEGHNSKGENYLKINLNGIPEGVEIISKSTESLKVLLEPKVSVQKSVRLNIMGNPSHGMAAMTPAVAPYDVVITGAESQVNKIKTVRVDVDIASVNSEVKKVLPVRVLDENGKDLQNVSIDPGTVEVSIPIENTKRAALETDLSGQPASGYVMRNVLIQPREILVTGKQDILEGISSIKTEKIDISGGTEDIIKQVKLILPEGIEIVNPNETVEITVKIEKIITSETVIENLDYVNLPDNLKLESIQGPVKALLRGAESQLAVPNAVMFYVDLAHAAEGSNVLNILWEAAQGIEVISVEPRQATVILRKAD